ncbi:MAG: TSUP family transporter [Cyanobacteria bacterium RI_101]|nr:TSUP family transporter [Cyanobacteria bacterium RI_101]
MTLLSSHLFLLGGAGLIAGLLAGLLGIGGGTILVPLLVTLNYTPVQAVATSSLSIVITSLSGSLHNWRRGYLRPQAVLALGIPALVTAQIGVVLSDRVPSQFLLLAFGCLLLFNLGLMQWRLRLGADGSSPVLGVNPALIQLLTGAAAGFLAGFFGVGGGVILVPLQMVGLGRPLKEAIQTSLGVIILTALAAVAGHALQGNVLWRGGLLLGAGGLVGAQITARWLPRLPARVVNLCFSALLLTLAVYTFGQALLKPF